MRRTAVEMAALAALLLVGALACGQEAPPPQAGADKPKDAPAKSKLEEMLQKALQDNPDLRLAAAKVAEAEAELNRARLKVVQKVGAAYQAIEAQKAAVETAIAELTEVKTHHEAGIASEATLRAAQGKLLDAKAKLAALETEMPYLIGKQPANNAALPTGALNGPSAPALYGMYGGGGGLGQLGGGLGALGGGLGQLGGGFGALGGGLGQLGGGGGVGGGALGANLGPFNPGDEAPKPVPVLGKTAERIRAALDKPFSLDLKAKLSTVIAEVSAAFQKANPGLLIKCNFPPNQLSEELENVRFDEMPFGAVLVWIEDSVGNGAVVVRDYGLVIAPNDQLPPGAPTLHDFWKGTKGEEKTPAKDQSSNPPTENIQGVVKTVNPAGLVLISIGKDVGIAKGNTLEVYRIDVKAPEQSKYLGRIKIIEATPTGAVGQPIGKMAGPVQVGDQVSSGIVGD